MSSDLAIAVEHLSKCYQIYSQPRDRLKQFILPRLQRMTRQASRKYYREFWALKDVSFDVKKGETLGIVGRNGSGKSTLLQMICGTLNQTAGTIRTYGRIAALLELGSGFNGDFSGRENVYLNASVLGLSRSEIDQRFDDIAAFADIGEFIDQPVKTYSSGMFVRLAFAVIAHVDADILVIDEALAVGDAYFTQKCMRFLRRFRENGTLIFVSHDSGAVTALCDTAIWLDKGQLRMQGAAKQVSESYHASLYEGGASAVREEPETQERAVAEKLPEGDCVADPRMAEINRTTLRNDLEVFQFSPEGSAEFGVRGAEIRNVAILDERGGQVTHVIGGEVVRLRVEAVALQTIDSPIVGFSIKDRLGQILFGDNTYISCRQQAKVVEAGKTIRSDFVFRMPILPAGNYSVAAAIASGTQDDHVQHHWIHDSVIIRSVSSSVSTGLVGIPMRKIELFAE